MAAIRKMVATESTTARTAMAPMVRCWARKMARCWVPTKETVRTTAALLGEDGLLLGDDGLLLGEDGDEDGDDEGDDEPLLLLDFGQQPSPSANTSHLSLSAKCLATPYVPAGIVDGTTGTAARFFRPDDPDRIDHRERQIDRTIDSVVQDQLCLRRAASRERFHQLKSPEWSS